MAVVVVVVVVSAATLAAVAVAIVVKAAAAMTVGCNNAIIHLRKLSLKRIVSEHGSASG